MKAPNDFPWNHHYATHNYQYDRDSDSDQEQRQLSDASLLATSSKPDSEVPTPVDP